MLRGNRRRADGGGQRIAPGERVGIGERRGPRIEAVEQVEGGRAQRPAGDLEPATPGKYVDFVDLGRLQLQRPRICQPTEKTAILKRTFNQ